MDKILTYTIQKQILENINDYESFKNFCSLNKQNFVFCKNNQNLLKNVLIKIFKINYKEPTNFIYVYNKVDINDFKRNVKEFDLSKILKLYLKNYNEKKIDCNTLGITSFPVYPNLENLIIYGNRLKDFPIQPKLKSLIIYNNNLESFPIQPELVDLFIGGNNLKTFPIQPKLEFLNIINNELTEFPVQPKLEELNIANNRITYFPSQPNLIDLNISNNPIEQMGIQPKLEDLIN